MRLFAAGSQVKLYERGCRFIQLPKLYSILNDKRGIINFKDGYFDLMVDSGAHTWNKQTIQHLGIKKVKELPDIEDHLKSYIDFMVENKNRKIIFVELDTYAVLPLERIDEMRQTIHKIKDKKFQYMRVYHPLIDGGSLEILKKWINEDKEEYIGVGNDSTYLLDKVFNLTRDKVKVHGFAMTKMNLLKEYPFYSADSTSPLSTLMYGNYISSDLKKTGKKEIHKAFNHGLFGSNNHRLWDAIVNFKKAEVYLTRLWKERGVVWND